MRIIEQLKRWYNKRKGGKLEEECIMLDGQIVVENEEELIIRNQIFNSQKINGNYFYIFNTYFSGNNMKELIKEIIDKTRIIDIRSGLLELNMFEEEKIIMSYNRMNLKWDIIKGKTL